ncbi:helix-turn-helix domain-containing protein [Chitinophaga sp. sic0106]|uniref:helix-turn-helix domain-containing protein n=1 Tax=Chitinophaga sp. sic0106 TaxID=2854785 RepID=UPI001C46123D|nr:helix-turn-helix domain-containing protein [Chitinophaga sp. sic0106]MBV7530980.1 helix-turn-helix domain-containing protein [Chitinophaga sp. sic0106]
MAKQTSSYRIPSNPDLLVTYGDLQNFHNDLLKSIRQAISELLPKASPKWLKTYQVQRLLGCSAGTLLTLRSNGTLPFSKIGGTIFYSVDDIEKLLQSRKENSNNSKSKL